ncbi:MAG: hypothetical protein ACLSF3_03590 [Anaerobutyricum hallii]
MIFQTRSKTVSISSGVTS